MRRPVRAPVEEDVEEMGQELRLLDARSREVLASVICTYIRSASPVSSRQLTKVGNFALSSASLRNAMADLEDLGMLTHPHISAGRVPTDRGYRVFVGDLMTRTEPTSKEKQDILDGLDSEPFALDRFLMATSRILSRLTGEVALVVAPDPAHFVLSAVHFARVAERKLLVVQVADTGLVESRLVETREDFTTRELEDAGRRLTVDFAGRSLWEIRRILVVALAEEKARFDAEVGKTLALGAIAFDGSADAETRVFVEGTDTILDKPEFRTDVEALRRMFRALDEKVRLVNLVNDCLSSEPGGASVVIGSESPFTEEAGGAVVSAPYRRGERVVGALGVFGPRRMEYTRILPLVEELARYVTRRMTEGTI